MENNSCIERSRPELSGPSPPEFKEGLLSWSFVDDRMRSAVNYWIASASVEGRPHTVPIWGAWLEGRFFFVGGGRKVRNLRANPHAVVHLESGNEVVLIEGQCTEITAPSRELLSRVDDEFLRKYPDFRPSEQLQLDGDSRLPPGGLFVVHPEKVIAWSGFASDATRWRFRCRS